MKQIVIGFSKPKKHWFPLLSWAIRFFGKTKFSHVYVKTSTRYGVDLIYQASGLEVNFRNGNAFKNENDIICEFDFEITDQVFDSYMEWAILNEGKPYSLKQLCGLWLMLALGLEKNPFRSGQSDYVCSELVGEIVSFFISQGEWSEENLDSLTPKDVYEFCLVKGVMR